MKKICLLVVMGGAFLFNLPAHACTVWGAITPNEVLIAKNRDFYPGNQHFKTISNQGKYRFFGLYGDNEYDNKYTIKMGVNQTGLVVFMTFASTIPLDQRKAKVAYCQVMETILGNYNSVDVVYADSDHLFKDSTPINYVFADRNKAMICELGLKNNFQCATYARSNKSEPILFAQTNHYILPGLEQYNLTPQINQQTSYYRYDKIMNLLQQHSAALNFEKFINFSFNAEAKNDEPLAAFDKGYDNTYQDNCIFRTFNSHPDRKNGNHLNSDQGVSTMVVKLPVDQTKPVELYLRIIKKITDRKDKNYTQDVEYSAAITTLDMAISHPESIEYVEKSCVRTAQSKACI